jgi:aromatic-L-amino-acid decarboxylase
MTMDWSEFGKAGADAAAWAQRYHETLRDRPVRAQVAPGAILGQVPQKPPDHPEDLDRILGDLDQIVLPGMTHWQHPRFFAYFPANAAPISVLAEFYVSAMAAQCMLWQTSPAATELETRVVDWMRQAVGLPDGFSGSIQDSASTATLCAVLTMREKALGWAGNSDGLAGQKPVRIYASDQVHSSIDRAIWVSGIGEANLVRIPVTGPDRQMDVGALRAAIADNRASGYLPAGVIACVGGTSVGATDDLREVLAVARAEGLYSHVDAAWAGAAMICPEFRTLWEGVEMADSVVLNPHKWLGAQFDCTTHFVAEPADLVRTLAIQPEYLKTAGADGIINYSEWTVPLGRRFRALKLWFLIRAHGLDGLRDMIRDHVRWSADLAERLGGVDGIEIVTPPMLSLFSFRLSSGDERTEALLHKINDDGRIYLTQTRVDGAYVIRFQAGAFTTTREDVDMAFDVITELAATV